MGRLLAMSGNDCTPSFCPPQRLMFELYPAIADMTDALSHLSLSVLKGIQSNCKS